MSFDYAFKLSSYLFLLSGFATLLASGGTTLPVALLYLALAASSWRSRLPYLSSMRQLFLVVLLLGWFLVDLRLFSGFLDALVHLMVLISLVKLFGGKSNRDYLLIYLISFAFVLLASAYAVSAIFLATLLLYVFFFILTLILLESRAAYEENRSAFFSLRAYVSVALAMTSLIILVSIPLFIVIPRSTFGFFGTDQSAFRNVAGFSDRVTLGDLGRILSNSTIVMRVRVDLPLQRVPLDLKWRGVALDHYDGRTWTNTRRGGRRILRDGRWGSFLIPRDHRQKERRLRQEVFLEPFSNVVFGAPDVILISGIMRRDQFIQQDGNGSFSLYPAPQNRIRYYIVSDVLERREKLALIRPGDPPPAVARIYLQLPDVSRPIRTLADAITGDQTTPIARALAIEHYLKTRYRYSLDNVSASATDPLEHFLFVGKAAHCEYFAAAQAVLMRCVGIPARVVTGFRLGEQNRWSGHFVVRQSDAHSWVEGYFEGAGWIEFDATPPAPESDSFFMASLAGQLLDAIDAFWTEVITFDRISQMSAFRWARASFREVWLNTLAVSDRIGDFKKKWWDKLTHVRWLNWAGAVWVLGGLAVGWALHRYRRYVLFFWKRVVLRQRASNLAPEYYLEMLDLLRRKGHVKRPPETPAEFAARIQAQIPSPAPTRITSLYYRNRFGELPLAPHEISEIYTLLRQLSHSPGVGSTR